MDAMWPFYEQALKPLVQFRVGDFRVGGNHAYISCDVLRPDGRPVGMMLPGGMGNAYGNSILRRSGEGWTVLDWSLAPGDVWYCDPADRGVPCDLLLYC